MNGAIPFLPVYAFVTLTGKTYIGIVFNFSYKNPKYTWRPRTHEEEAVHLRSFLNSALDGYQCPVSHPDRVGASGGLHS
jgi:hypothetical protein